uniref:Si:ch211-107m4.1 n=1 Tax=Tetraodon nigroviridis TaxID=99883 RepID=H3BYE8_TETNG
MKLDDIKKLKVPELRFKLKELGLEAKGLKAELVTRLWSASEAGKCKDVEENYKEKDTVVTDGILVIQTIPTDTLDAPPEEAGTSGKMDPGRELSDAATQTETDTDLSHKHSQAVPARGPGPQAAQRQAGIQQGDEDDCEESGGAQASEERGRGRAFYEFKEEIRYKRQKMNYFAMKVGRQINSSFLACTDDSHLHFEMAPDGCGGQPLFWDRFPSLWSGCRLTHGVGQGGVGFEVRVEALLTTRLDQKDEEPRQGLRVGWSPPDASLLLGEDDLSFAYDGRGIKVSGGTKEKFGEPFTVGDIIGCYASFSTDAVEISFQKNGRFMGAAFSLGRPALRGRPLLPHVLCKGCSVSFHLDPAAPPWYPAPASFAPLVALPAGQLVRAALAPPSHTQCEVLLMVGLPGSGKSHWARTHRKQHPDKHYRLLGTEELLSCMIVSLLRGSMTSVKQRENQLQQAAQCLTELIKLAAQTPGNYILDQCNILFSARRYKLQLFAAFRRKVLVVFPSADEWKRRLSEHQPIPETALLKLQLSCRLPEPQSELLEELQYLELPGEQAQKLLREYQDQAHRLLPPVPK